MTKQERIINALIAIEVREMYKTRLKHYSQFRARKIADQPNISPRDLAELYFADYPDCCELRKPWPFEYYPLTGETEFADEQVAHAYKIKWTHNVIVRDPAGEQIPFADKDIRDGELTDPMYRRAIVKSYACGETERPKDA
ncbi:hypothetical protein [Erythrobacter sp. F6033]|uniref:hypothetical protein n=1 Tax=Erythrobacter sp. F6033 TaxID=2926401 RepID=UPI001FF6F91B|nr:hypothetical protein [Erythrobacter sp. F6033]MCK0128948.1 hypothetical protein [Erythrobacter sp. F6033]